MFLHLLHRVEVDGPVECRLGLHVDQWVRFGDIADAGKIRQMRE